MSAPPGDDDGSDSRIVLRLVQRGGNRLSGRQAQAVDRRVIQGDERHVAVDFVFSRHACLVLDCEEIKKYGRSDFS